MAEKVYLDEETKKQLMGLAPFSAEVTFEFTPSTYEKRGVKSDFRPVFSLRVFTKAEQDSVIAALNDDVNTGKKLFEITRKVVMGWRNVLDIGSLEMIEFKGDKSGCDENLFGRISQVDRSEIFAHLSFVSGLRKVETLGLGS